MASDKGDEDLDMGHSGAGDNCLERTTVYAMNGATAGAVYGSFAACFLTPVKGSTTPMIARALRVVAANSVFLASVSGIFAGSCCLSARLRNKDDPWNAAVGGAAAGSVFGLRALSLPMGLGMAAGLAFTCAVIKHRFGTYVPQLPNPTHVKRILPTPTLSSVDDHSKSH